MFVHNLITPTRSPRQGLHRHPRALLLRVSLGGECDDDEVHPPRLRRLELSKVVGVVPALAVVEEDHAPGPEAVAEERALSLHVRLGSVSAALVHVRPPVWIHVDAAHAPERDVV